MLFFGGGQSVSCFPPLGLVGKVGQEVAGGAPTVVAGGLVVV
jgi:hypothetical protein